MFDWIASPEAWVALGTLTALEIVLGIDNIIFISILSGRLPEDQQPRARTIGLGIAMGMRILLLLSISWVMGLTAPLFELGFLEGIMGGEVHGGERGDLPWVISGRDLILLIGGAFLVAKSTHEIHGKLEGDAHHATEKGKGVSFTGVLIQIAILDIVFSLDSVITAVGMADEIMVMIIAVVIAVGVMMAFATPISDFVHHHPTVKMLALAFLILIGVNLVAEGLGQHIPKGYIYTAMAFSLLVEFLNIRSRKASGERAPVELRSPYAAEGTLTGMPLPDEIRRPGATSIPLTRPGA
ncbi:MAG: TerC family protein [Rhodothermales bacterium]